MIKLIQTHSAGVDCTAQYEVEMDKPYTVCEFVEEVLARNQNEWGFFRIKSHDKFLVSEYDGNKLFEDLPVDLTGLKVGKAMAAGAFGRIEYNILAEIPYDMQHRYPFNANGFSGPNGIYLAAPNPMWISDIFVWGNGYLIKYNSQGTIEEVLKGDISDRAIVPIKAVNVRPASQMEIAALKQSVMYMFGVDIED